MTRPIDERYRPGVAGIDLEQALNYIEVSKAGVEFCYNHYTNSNLTYVKGSRPKLESVAAEVAGRCPAAADKVQSLATWVADTVPWAGYYEKAKGYRLPADRAMTEEELIESGYGWCNEQARLLCCLTQVIGITSRIVFAGNNQKKYGHCVTEVLLPEGWLMVDQSLGFCFTKAGRPVRAVDVFGEPGCRAYFEPIYKKLCGRVEEVLGRDLLSRSFAMAVAENPLDGFSDIGFHNHFVH